MQCRKSFLFHNEEPWIKKCKICKKDKKCNECKNGQKTNFDVTMGSYDGAEICELVGLYLLHKMTSGKSPIFKSAQVGLYRDDCLAVINGSARVVEAQVRELFMKEKLKIVAEPSAQVTDFLDVQLNLITREFKPYRKPNDNPIYINAKSNHPPTIIKKLPQMIEHRISTLSSSQEIFNSEIGTYEKALRNSGHDLNGDRKLKYKTSTEKKKRIRTRQITYFNPPFSKSVTTQIGKLFLELIDRHFKGTILEEHFNKSTIKVSYSTMSNVKDHIAKNNAKVNNAFLKCNDGDKEEKKYNCTKKF